MEVVKGQIVHSRQGRDVTRAYVALATEGEARSGRQRVLVCDGAKWTLAAPKRKNPRHLAPTKTVLPPEETTTDLKIKTALSAYEGRVKKGG